MLLSGSPSPSVAQTSYILFMTSAGTIKPGLRVGIVGAGIGGLSLALALRERGLQADVFEQAQELTEIGAAIGLAGNGIREYARLGLLDELAAAFTFPTELIYRHWQDGSRIAAHPVRKDDWYQKQLGRPGSASTAPTCRCHRGSRQRRGPHRQRPGGGQPGPPPGHPASRGDQRAGAQRPRLHPHVLPGPHGRDPGRTLDRPPERPCLVRRCPARLLPHPRAGRQRRVHPLLRRPPRRPR